MFLLKEICVPTEQVQMEAKPLYGIPESVVDCQSTHPAYYSSRLLVNMCTPDQYFLSESEYDRLVGMVIIQVYDIIIVRSKAFVRKEDGNKTASFRTLTNI